MSSVYDDSDGKSRVTRGSLRRMASMESLTDLESRPDTPTVPLRTTKKLQTITENVTTPSKNVNSQFNSPRRTRKNSEDVISSPFRRTTRGMSQEKDIAASPLTLGASTAKRRSTFMESDSDDVQVGSSTPGRQKSARKPRKSVAADQIKEEPEEETGEKEASKSSIDGNTSNDQDLELRTRSISKSPKSLLRDCKVVISKTSSDEIEFLNASDQNGSTEKTSRHSDELPKVTFSDVTERGSKSCELPKSGKAENENPPPSKGRDEQDDVNISGLKVIVNTPVNGSRSFNEEKSPDTAQIQNELAKMIRDFNDDSDPQDVNASVNDSKTPKSSKTTPQSQKKTPKSEKKTPKSSRENPEGIEGLKTPPGSIKTPQSEIKTVESLKTPSSSISTPQSKNRTIETPPTIKRIVESLKTPQSTKKTAENSKTPTSVPKTSNETPAGPSSLKGTPQRVDKTSNSTKKTQKSSQDSCDTTSMAEEYMEISRHDTSDMEVDSPSPAEKVASAKKATAETDLKRVSIGERSSSVKKAAAADSSHSKASAKLSLSFYLDKAATFRRSVPAVGSENAEEGEKSPSTVATPRRSWSQSVRKNAYDAIDTFPPHQPETIEKSPTVHQKSISSDESDDEYEKNSYIDDEAEVGSEGDSITESERNYLAMNEILEEGESIGSQDSEELELEATGEEEEDDDDSFIDRGDVSDEYSMDSHEEEVEVEESPPKPKRKSRIILPSSSEDEDVKEPAEVEPSGLQSTSPVVAEVSKKTLKRKREEGLGHNVSGLIKTKRAKMSDSIANETEAAHMEDFSGISQLWDMESSEEGKQVEVPKKVGKQKHVDGAFDVQAIISKCDEVMGSYNKEKKLKLALKREKKAQKLALKAAEKAAGDNLDSSNGENKENAVKKKKKKKAKKPKFIDDMPEKKEDMASAVSRIQEKMERKRLRKLEKKLLKQQAAAAEQPEGIESQEVAVDEQSEGPAATEKRAKKSKKAKAVEASPTEEYFIKKPKKKQLEVEPEAEPEAPIVKKKRSKIVEVVPEASAVVDGKKAKKKKTSELVEEIPSEVTSQSKKKKKSELIEEIPMEVAESQSKKKKKKEVEPFEEPIAVEGKKKKKTASPVPEVPQVELKKKGKKRKLEEAVEVEEEEKPKAKKKLNILKQIEDPLQFQNDQQEGASKQLPETVFSVPLASQKLKKIIPQKLNIEKKKRKKAANRRAIAEPSASLPRPVWTTSGLFLEEPASPYKFQPTDYVPINAGGSGSTKFGVVVFDAKKKKPSALQQHNSEDFKSKAMFRNKQKRDGSSKNIRGLLASQRTV